jgi:2-keto-3-deoxygluconate permease
MKDVLSLAALLIARAPISIAVILTAVLCPVTVIPVDRWQRARRIIGTAEETRP